MPSIEQMLEQDQVPVVVASQEGFILRVNHAFEKIFGWSSAEAVGQLLTLIIPANLHDAHHLGFSRFISTGQTTLLNQPLRLKAVSKGGREFDAEHFIVAEKSSDHWTFAATIRPL